MEAIPKECGQIVPKVGMPIAKHFPTGEVDEKKQSVVKRFCGSVATVDADHDGKNLYHIVYDDGDEEDMHIRECRMACKLYCATIDSDDLESDSD